MNDSSELLHDVLFLISAEIAVAQNYLLQAARAAAHDRFIEAKELLSHAKDAHRTIISHISKLPQNYDARRQAAVARIIEGGIAELEQHITTNGHS